MLFFSLISDDFNSIKVPVKQSVCVCVCVILALNRNRINPNMQINLPAKQTTITTTTLHINFRSSLSRCQLKIARDWEGATSWESEKGKVVAGKYLCIKIYATPTGRQHTHTHTQLQIRGLPDRRKVRWLSQQIKHLAPCKLWGPQSKKKHQNPAYGIRKLATTKNIYTK